MAGGLEGAQPPHLQNIDEDLSSGFCIEFALRNRGGVGRHLQNLVELKTHKLFAAICFLIFEVGGAPPQLQNVDENQNTQPLAILCPICFEMSLHFKIVIICCMPILPRGARSGT